MNFVSATLPRTLVAANALVWAMFLVLRSPIASEELQALDRREKAERLESGVSMDMSSGEPYGILASRYLRNWSNWHGGEDRWVKVIMAINAPALIATAIPAIAFGFFARGIVPVAVRSWLYFGAFLAISSFMWLSVGTLLVRAFPRHGGHESGRGGHA